MSDQAEWHEYHDNRVALGRYLLDVHCLTGNRLQSYYEKPWKWNSEWREYQEICELQKSGPVLRESLEKLVHCDDASAWIKAGPIDVSWEHSNGAASIAQASWVCVEQAIDFLRERGVEVTG